MTSPRVMNPAAGGKDRNVTWAALRRLLLGLLLGLMFGSLTCVAVAGCAASPASPARTSVNRARLAADYLAIAGPANRRLETEVDSYARHEHHALSHARAALRAQAATERAFDQSLLQIPFPPRIAAIARALVRANNRRIALTEQQARSSSVAELMSFDSLHKVADAGVEARVRIIRVELGLPPPDNS